MKPLTKKKKLTPPPPDTTEAVFHSLLKTWGLLRQAQEPYFAHFGITASQWGPLRVLHRSEANGEPGLPLKDLSERLMIQPPSVTGVVDRMERQGLVKRVASKSDLRVRLLSLTPQGRALVEEVLKCHAERIKLLLSGLSKDDQETMHTLLEQLKEHLTTLVSNQSEGTAVQTDDI